MKILVPIKRVIDHSVRIRIKSDGSGVEAANVKMAMNPFDEIAVEAAVRIKEQGIAQEVILVAIGPADWQETLRYGLALGADRAILLETTAQYQPLSIAKVLKQIVYTEQAQLVILGKQAIDGDNNQTGQMLAGLLNWPQGTFVSQIVVDHERQTVKVTREIDGGLETLLLNLPAVITTDLRLNKPRYISLPNIMLAKRKPLIVKQLADLNLELKSNIIQLKIEPPSARKAGLIVSSVTALVDKLKNEAKVI